ncbi:hypothetical protein RJ640_018941 [Escallonia rubra]|uniref:Uncharacterized protein n=1 Tax=Escallonia rubra TaxID=112253 RepID=A0AA88RE87_9ASTE|nr:hypothetical protein RJ640_018941 [Escallonia rubra]
MATSTGFCYSDVSSGGNHQNSIQNHLLSHGQLHQTYESNPAAADQLYNMTSTGNMDQLIGFPPPKTQGDTTNSVMWKGLFGKMIAGGNQHHGGGGVGGPSTSKAINEEATTTSDFYQHEFSSKPDFTSVVSDHTTTAWHENRLMLVGDHEDPSSLRSCHVFPCEQNERPSQGLSLSLSSTNPSTIGLQSFQLRAQQQEAEEDQMRFFAKSSMNTIHQQQLMMQDGFLGKAASNNLLHPHHQVGHFQIRNSKYLVPAQQLLNEFCNIGTKHNSTESDLHPGPPKSKQPRTNQYWQDDQNASTPSSSKNKSLFSLELLELQKRKAKLLQMLEEVDRRYKNYCDQMKAVVSSFEAVAGNGAATVYSALASKAMSRHFRSLRDGIVDQIKATKKAMGEKDTATAPGSTRGETPRLRLLDQSLRQQRAFQQMSMMESHPWRPQRGLPERSVSVLRAWLFEHFLHPYPSDVDKHILARQTGLSRSQASSHLPKIYLYFTHHEYIYIVDAGTVSNWFINARVRLWKPMVEEMYLEETKEQDNLMMGSPSPDGGVPLTTAQLDDVDNGSSRQNQTNPHPHRHHHTRHEDQKPTPEQLVRIDSECLSSIININPPDHHHKTHEGKISKTLQSELHHQEHSYGRITDTFGAVELDFSAYNAHQSFGGASGSGNGNGNGNGAGNVSLTLGLQQHGGTGVGLAFSPASQSSLFYTRDHIEDCQQVQYSLLDGEGQNLPYRNLMGAQLLHDLAG